MLLRRVTSHIKTQNWTAVFLDFVIVVVGVFIGIQVSNWNAEGRDNALGEQYVGRILADVEGDLDRLRQGDSFADDRIAQIQILTDAIADPQSVSDKPEAFFSALEKATWRSYEPIRPKAYAELTATGRTPLIKPISLRDDIARYYAVIDRWERLVAERRAQNAFGDATAGLLSAKTLEAIETAEQSGAPPPLDLIDQDAVAVAEALAAIPEAARWLPKLHHHQILVKEINARNRANAISLMEEIQALHPQFSTRKEP